MPVSDTPVTSAFGYKQTLAGLKTTSALHPGADLPGGVSKGLLLTQSRHDGAAPVASMSPDRTGVCRESRGAPSAPGLFSGLGFRSPNRPDKGRNPPYRAGSPVNITPVLGHRPADERTQAETASPALCSAPVLHSLLPVVHPDRRGSVWSDDPTKTTT